MSPYFKDKLLFSLGEKFSNDIAHIISSSFQAFGYSM